MHLYAAFPLTSMSACLNSNPSQAASKNLSDIAWTALHQNDWQKALEIIPHIDFGLEDINHFRLLCCTYLQAEHWRTLSAVASVAAEHFPSEPVFWEIWAWAEYVQGHTGSALRILESVIPPSAIARPLPISSLTFTLLKICKPRRPTGSISQRASLPNLARLDPNRLCHQR